MTSEEFIAYQRDVTEAHQAFPDMEMGAAYRKFMLEIKKQSPRKPLNTKDKSLEAAKSMIKQTLRRPCTQEGCSGTQIMQGVCEGCLAGKKGFKSLWECEECLYREYSKIPYLDWYNKLKGSNGDD